MWVLLMVFFSNFQMGFYFVTTGWSFEIGLCENSIQFNSNNRYENMRHDKIPMVHAGYNRYRSVKLEGLKKLPD